MAIPASPKGVQANRATVNSQSAIALFRTRCRLAAAKCRAAAFFALWILLRWVLLERAVPGVN